MKLEDYLYYEKISQRQFARTIGLNWRYFHGLVTGEYIPGRKTAIKIEEITQGKVTALELLFPRPVKPTSRTAPKSSPDDTEELPVSAALTSKLRIPPQRTLVRKDLKRNSRES